ncbi:MAG TPA: NfeD family protein, partial [Candidatus Deferrimicrobiaceae bacterium]
FRASSDPFLRVSWTVLITMAVVSAAFFGGVISLAVRSQLRKPVSGPEGMIGAEGEALLDFDGKGKVRVLGELWDARCDVPLRKGDRVVVTAREGMMLIVARGGGHTFPSPRG